MKEFYPSINNIYYHLSPPFIGKDAITGRPKKIAIPSYFVRPLFIFLSAFRKLRGTPFDVLGYRKDRRDEKELVSMYISDIELVKELDTSTKWSEGKFATGYCPEGCDQEMQDDCEKIEDCDSAAVDSWLAVRRI